MKFTRHAAALAGYVALTLVFTFPLVLHFSDRVIFGPSGDYSWWIWDLWYFRYAVDVARVDPLWCDLIYWPYGVNMILQHGWFYKLAGYFLQRFFGLIAVYNMLLLTPYVLCGYAVFLGASLLGASWASAFVAGTIFAFSPGAYSQLWDGAGFDLLSRHTIAFFVIALMLAVRQRQLRYCLLAALMLTWAWGGDYYYFLVSTLFIPVFFLLVEKPIGVRVSKRFAPPGMAARVLDAALAANLCWIFWRLRQGQIEFHGRGSAATLVAYVFPYILFWGLLALRLFLSYSLSTTLDRKAFSWERVAPYVGTIACYAVLNLPLILAVLELMKDGNTPSPPRAWRGGGNPTELLWLLHPGIHHPLWGHWSDVMGGESRHVPSGYLPMIAAIWLWIRRPTDRWVKLWFGCLAFALLLTMGPWLKIGGIHTYLPMPFYFVHLLPIYNNMQNGHRFASALVTLFLALLFAPVLEQFKSGAPRRWAAWIPWLAFLWLAVEFAHDRLRLIAVETPAIFERLGQRPTAAMLTVPTGALFDGITSSSFGHVPIKPHYQIAHRKPIVGGLMGRVPGYVHRAMVSDPLLSAMVSAQSGAPVPDRLRDRSFLRRHLAAMKIGYVMVFEDKIPEGFRRVLKDWPLRKIDEDKQRRIVLFQVERR